MTRQKKRAIQSAQTSRLLRRWGANYDEVLAEGYKMSEVLLDFIHPYLNDDIELEEQRLYFQIGTLAWNASFLPRHKWLSDIIWILKPFPPADQLMLKDIFATMIERKQQKFSEYRRCITDFELLDEGDDYRLFVLSAPVEDKEKADADTHVCNPTVVEEDS